MKIVVLGAPTDSGNRGVLALGAALSGLLFRASRGADVTLLGGQHRPLALETFMGGRRVSIRVVHYRLSPKVPLCEQLWWIVAMSFAYHVFPIADVRRRIAVSVPWIGALAECDLAGDVRGGDSFSDIYGMKRYILGFLAALTVLLVHGRLIQFPQTYGPYKSRIARWMACFLLRRSAVIVARDKESQRIAQKLAGPSKEVLLSPDVAFALEAVEPEEILLEPADDREDRAGTVGINVNGLMFNGGYDRANMFGLKLDYPVFLRELVSALFQAGAPCIWLVPHTYAASGNVESDNEACRILRDSLPPEIAARVHIVTKEYDQHEIKGVIGQCDFFVGSRMHSCIAALSQGIPCVGVAYSMKFRGVFESVGMEDWIVDGREVKTSDAVEEVVARFCVRNAVRQPLFERGEKARAELRRIFARLMNSGASLQTSARGMTTVVESGQ